jgi:hypothetical protein
MPDIPKPQGDILRRNAEHECGTPIGQVNLVIHGLPGFQTVSFYCNQPRLHRDSCKFASSELIVTANSQRLFITSRD